MAAVYDNEDDVHVSSYPWAGAAWRKSAVQKRVLMRRRSVYPVTAYIFAVVELQRIWRGVLLRRRVLRKFLENGFQRLWRLDEARYLQVYRRIPRASETQFVVLARKVQARWRTNLLRQEYTRWVTHERWPIYYVAAATIQRAWVDYRFLRKRKHHRSRSKRFYLTKSDSAAGKIQGCWRGYVSRQVFRFHVQLIRFRERGDPMLMLRCINPQEAFMMDPAAGLHVRFRLAGPQFPPTIVYKIFTHNNVADICSFAPKDYTKARKHPTPKMLFNNTQKLPDKKDRTGWYKRTDNNPWRPVSSDTLENAEEIAQKYVLAATTKQPDIIPADASFHYSRLQRRGEREAKIKRTRRQWLAELYAGEQQRLLVESESPQRRSAADIQREAATLFGSMKDEEVEAEVKRLVEWTGHLDFEAYRRDWLLLAATAPTDMPK